MLYFNDSKVFRRIRVQLSACRFPPIVRRTLTLLQLPPAGIANIAAETTVKHQIARSRVQPPIYDLKIELSITKVTLALAPNLSIINEPHPPPLILEYQPAGVPTTTSAIHAIHAAPPRPLQLMNSRPQNKIYYSNI
jgi:hypothetical protein